MHKRERGALKVLLVHPGGPFWAGKDDGAWSIPKGEHDASEEPLAAALREFNEELGISLHGACRPLGEVKQKGGKIVTAFAIEGDLDVARIRSVTFEMEWPPRSGRRRSFPEVDRAQWFSADEARRKILPSQSDLIDRLEALLEDGSGRSGGGSD
jgi:predicted NUDIX family NTP pyrophosphohydrolase